MGSDAACTLHLDGRATRGTALLEQHDLIFRGPVPARDPAQGDSVGARDRRLAGGPVRGADGDVRSRRAGGPVGRQDNQSSLTRR